MAKYPFVFPSTFSNSQSSIPSSSSSSPSPSFYSSSSYPSSPSLTSPFQPSHQSLPSPPSQNSSNHFSWPSKDVVGPCAACKILRRQCTDKCYLASYFPSTTEPHNFTVVGSLFGLSDVHEFLQLNSNSSYYVPLLLLLRDTSKDGNQLQANPSNNSNIVPYRTNVNINGKPMLANSENSKAHSYSSSSKPLNMFGTNDTGALTSPANQLGGNNNNNLVLQADMVGLNMLGGNVDQSDKVARKHDTEGFTFIDVNSVRASGSKVLCCDFSSDGKLLASGGHDKTVVLWDTARENLKSKTILEEHSSLITDVRFSPSMPQLATSSFDKTVKVWDTNHPNNSIRTFTGHSTPIVSIDFHPFKDDLICSCDADSELRYWSIQNGTCVKISKGVTTQIRFQPRLGRYLAAANENVVNIFDVETEACVNSFLGHYEPIYSLCWDPSGEYLASVSGDSVRLWCLQSGSVLKCVHALSCPGNKFHSCVFHPNYSSLLVIGGYQCLGLWNMAESRTMTLFAAHEGLISALAVSPLTSLIASASHDKLIKLWK